jgi:hypothetical protein
MQGTLFSKHLKEQHSVTNMPFEQAELKADLVGRPKRSDHSRERSIEGMVFFLKRMSWIKGIRV